MTPTNPLARALFALCARLKDPRGEPLKPTPKMLTPAMTLREARRVLGVKRKK